MIRRSAISAAASSRLRAAAAMRRLRRNRPRVAERPVLVDPESSAAFAAGAEPGAGPSPGVTRSLLRFVSAPCRSIAKEASAHVLAGWHPGGPAVVRRGSLMRPFRGMTRQRFSGPESAHKWQRLTRGRLVSPGVPQGATLFAACKAREPQRALGVGAVVLPEPQPRTVHRTGAGAKGWIASLRHQHEDRRTMPGGNADSSAACLR